MLPLMLGDCVRWIDREVHVSLYSSVRSRTAVRLKPGCVQQLYGESPDIFVNTRL